MANRAIFNSADDTVLQCPIGATLICLPTLSCRCEIPRESEKRHIRALRPFTQDENRRLQAFEAAHQTDRLPPEPTPPGGALATRATRQPTVGNLQCGSRYPGQRGHLLCLAPEREAQPRQAPRQ